MFLCGGPCWSNPAAAVRQRFGSNCTPTVFGVIGIDYFANTWQKADSIRAGWTTWMFLRVFCFAAYCSKSRGRLLKRTPLCTSPPAGPLITCSGIETWTFNVWGCTNGSGACSKLEGSRGITLLVHLFVVPCFELFECEPCPIWQKLLNLADLCCKLAFVPRGTKGGTQTIDGNNSW